ncbi:YbjQ family protein [Salibacterium aidingense]|uniref:YbjQ family protein n=1 Tax=Salibacterium aidingense TaxID=384933 RepID=UPI0004126067|nr:YbjQ family protein [Salibacterium aidingense]
MIIVSMEQIPGYEITEALGIVKGNTVRAKHLGKDFIGGFRSMVGGKMKEYEEMFLEARHDAEKEMIEKAEEWGAEAIVGVRYSSSSIMNGTSEVMVFGTAVKIRKRG